MGRTSPRLLQRFLKIFSPPLHFFFWCLSTALRSSPYRPAPSPKVSFLHLAARCLLLGEAGLVHPTREPSSPPICSTSPGILRNRRKKKKKTIATDSTYLPAVLFYFPVSIALCPVKFFVFVLFLAEGFSKAVASRELCLAHEPGECRAGHPQRTTLGAGGAAWLGGFAHGRGFSGRLRHEEDAGGCSQRYRSCSCSRDTCCLFSTNTREPLPFAVWKLRPRKRLKEGKLQTS